MTAKPPVGIPDVAHWYPPGFMPASAIAELSGIPEDVLSTKFGIVGKHVSEPDVHVSQMCANAAGPLLERLDHDEIDGVVYFGSHWKDYAVWQAAPKIQASLGLRGFAIEAVNVSSGAPIALKLVKDILTSDDDVSTILLVGAAKESHLLDYSNPRARFMFNFGDGAAAAIIRRGGPNRILGSAIVTDGSFSDHVKVPAGGSVHPASHQTVDEKMHYLDLHDPQGMKERLDPITLTNFIDVAQLALKRSDLDVTDIDLLLPIHMKWSLHKAILDELGLSDEQAIYLDTFGHMSAVDPLFALSLARDEGRLSDGDVVLMLAAGTGYTWAATVIRWGPV